MTDPDMPVLPVRTISTGDGGDVPSVLRLRLDVDALGRAVVPVYRGSAFGRREVVGYRLADVMPVEPAAVVAFFEREAARRRTKR